MCDIYSHQQEVEQIKTHFKNNKFLRCPGNVEELYRQFSKEEYFAEWMCVTDGVIAHFAGWLIQRAGHSEIDNEKTINFYPGNSTEPIQIKFKVPKDRDAEEYIDEYLDGILNDFLRYNSDWEFA